MREFKNLVMKFVAVASFVVVASIAMTLCSERVFCIENKSLQEKSLLDLRNQKMCSKRVVRVHDVSKIKRGHHGRHGKLGHTGNTGPQGSQGPQGPKGPSGSFNVILPTAQLTVQYIPGQAIAPSDSCHFEVTTPSGTVLVEPSFQLNNPIDLTDVRTFTIGPPLEVGTYSFTVVNENITNPSGGVLPVWAASVKNNMNNIVFWFPPGSSGIPFLIVRDNGSGSFSASPGDVVQEVYTTDFGVP